MFTGFLVVLEIMAVGLRVAAEYFSERIPFFGKLAAPLTWVCVILGIVCFVFLGIKAYKEIRNIKNKSDSCNVHFDITDNDWRKWGD